MYHLKLFCKCFVNFKYEIYYIIMKLNSFAWNDCIFTSPGLWETGAIVETWIAIRVLVCCASA